MDSVAHRELMARTPEGKEFSITVRLGQPYKSTDSEWACPVSIEGLHENLRDIRGVDSWQSLQLAFCLALDLLASFVEDGGRLFWRDSEEPIDIKDLAPKTPNQ